MTIVKRNEWYKIEPTGFFIAEDIIEVNCILLWDYDIGCLEKIGNYEDTGTENVHSQTLKNEIQKKHTGYAKSQRFLQYHEAVYNT